MKYLRHEKEMIYSARHLITLCKEASNQLGNPKWFDVEIYRFKNLLNRCEAGCLCMDCSIDTLQEKAEKGEANR